MKSDVTDTAKYCKYIFEIQGRRSSITLLNKSRLLLTHTNLTVECDNGTTFTIECASCVFNVPPNCQASNDQYHIAAMQTSEQVDNDQHTNQTYSKPSLATNHTSGQQTKNSCKI